MSSTSSGNDWATIVDLPQRLVATFESWKECRPLRYGRRFAPELSYGRHFGPAPHHARRAAVITLLFRRAGRWHVPLTVRPEALGRHGGQISLPGGSLEPKETSADAARRELAEELGVARGVELLGELGESYVYVSNFRVTSWVAATFDEPVWQPNVPEVERVLEIPLEQLLDPSATWTVTIRRGPIVFDAPCYRLGDDCVWGATSIILCELAGALRELLQQSATNE